MDLDEDYTLQELEQAVEGLNNPLSSIVKNPEVYREAIEALSNKIGTYTSGDLYRMLDEPSSDNQQLGYFSSAMEELGLVFEGDTAMLGRRYGSPQNAWANYRGEEFWKGLREDLDQLYSEEVMETVEKKR